MPTPAELVRRIYHATQGGWRGVAEACANGREYSPVYYLRVANGTLEPSGEALQGIRRAASEVTALLSPESVFRWWDSMPDCHDADMPLDARKWPRSRPGGNLPAIARAARLAAAEMGER